jgi:hypothetical protein
MVRFFLSFEPRQAVYHVAIDVLQMEISELGTKVNIKTTNL